MSEPTYSIWVTTGTEALGGTDSNVYIMLFAELDGSDNGEPFIPPFVRSNIEDVMQEVGFQLKSYDPSKALTQGRIAVKP